MKAMYKEINSDEQIALDLVHDIASPLNMMQLNIQSIKEKLPLENLTMMQEAIDQIREITHAALNKKSPAAKINLNVVVQQIILEKKYAWKENPCTVEVVVKNEADNFDVCASNVEIYNMLSDLLNCAYESLSDKRKIMITLDQSSQHVILGVNHSDLHKDLSSALKYMQVIGGNLLVSNEIQLFFPR